MNRFWQLIMSGLPRNAPPDTLPGKADLLLEEILRKVFGEMAAEAEGEPRLPESLDFSRSEPLPWGGPSEAVDVESLLSPPETAPFDRLVPRDEGLLAELLSLLQAGGGMRR